MWPANQPTRIVCDILPRKRWAPLYCVCMSLVLYFGRRLLGCTKQKQKLDLHANALTVRNVCRDNCTKCTHSCPRRVISWHNQRPYQTSELILSYFINNRGSTKYRFPKRMSSFRASQLTLRANRSFAQKCCVNGISLNLGRLKQLGQRTHRKKLLEQCDVVQLMYELVYNTDAWIYK